jgi:hypothetical protein
MKNYTADLTYKRKAARYPRWSNFETDVFYGFQCEHEGSLFLLDTEELQWLQVDLRPQHTPFRRASSATDWRFTSLWTTNVDEEEVILSPPWRHLYVSVEEGILPGMEARTSYHGMYHHLLLDAHAHGRDFPPETPCPSQPPGLTHTQQWHKAWLRHICNQIGT